MDFRAGLHLLVLEFEETKAPNRGKVIQENPQDSFGLCPSGQASLPSPGPCQRQEVR
jgi:hypothetical protein